MSRENAGANCNIENTCISVSQVIDSYSEGLKLVRLLDKIEHTHRKLLYFVNRHNAKSSKSPKIKLSKKNFYGEIT